MNSARPYNFALILFLLSVSAFAQIESAGARCAIALTETGRNHLLGAKVKTGRGLQYIIHVVVPLLIGGTVYLTWRVETLQMFRWIELVHLDGAIHAFRETYGGQGAQLPAWLLYSLPDAAWTYSFSMYMGLIWIDTRPRVAFSLAALGPALGIGLELGQALRVVPGTFDIADILLQAVAFLLSIIVLVSNRGMSR